MTQDTAIETVRQAVEQWDGVTTHQHRFGGVEFRLGRRELGHLHRSFADLPFPRRVRDDLVRAGRAQPHHILPESGWVTAPMRTGADVQNVIELFRENYQRYRSSPGSLPERQELAQPSLTQIEASPDEERDIDGEEDVSE
jgi:Luciferase